MFNQAPYQDEYESHDDDEMDESQAEYESDNDAMNENEDTSPDNDEMDESDEDDEDDNKWIKKYENNEHLHQSNCVYMSLTILHNSYMKINGEELDQYSPKEHIGCLKLGSSATILSSAYTRFLSQFDTYDAVWTMPILVIPCENPSELEGIIKNALKECQVRIGCSKKCHYKVPTEFFEVAENVVNIVKDVARKYKCKEINCIQYDLDEDSTLDRLVPEEFYPLFAETIDSLDKDDIRIIHQTWK